ncbi:MAG: tRNA (guanosine(46)-N7)-methyltransferase TrmB [Verrucomicrobiota bacterium]|nr:tRNA (guanosine(46)-N7)-methyltransferase TrmB [Verrucomicrobiota bacterium]
MNSIRTQELPSFIFRPESILERIDYKSLFPSLQPVELELGSGDGSFLSKYAALHLERNFLALERLLGRLRKLDRKCARAGLTNVRMLRMEAAYFVEYMIPKGSLSAIHIYFPDPWPKRKQRKNRLINERFVLLSHQALLSGGKIYLRTDDADYFQQMTTVYDSSPLFKKDETPDELSAVITDFERNFNARGVATNRAAYQRT